MNSKQALGEFKKIFEKLSYSQDYSTTFSSFLDFSFWRLAPYCNESLKEDFQRLDKMYKKDAAEDFIKMFELWSIASDYDGVGFYDALGDLFMECVSFGRNGQFFTPQEICDMMAKIIIEENELKDNQAVCDPACGSGRTLLGIAKINRRLKFYASDIDLTCVKMCVLNMMINCMEGEIAWMDTLRMEHFRSYHIKNINYGGHYLPFLTITGKNETHFIERLKNTNIGKKEEESKSIQVPIKSNKTQQLILQF